MWFKILNYKTQNIETQNIDVCVSPDGRAFWWGFCIGFLEMDFWCRKTVKGLKTQVPIFSHTVSFMFYWVSKTFLEWEEISVLFEKAMFFFRYWIITFVKHLNMCMLTVTSEYRFCMVLQDIVVESIMKNNVIWKSIRLKSVK